MDEIAVESDLKLRLVRSDFAEEAFATVQRNRDLLKIWLPWVRTTTNVNDEHDYFSTSSRRHGEGKCMEMGIFKRDDTGSWKFIGMCGLVEISRNSLTSTSHAEIGYWLDKSHHGGGIITKCCRKIIQTTFTELEIDTVKIMANKNNTPSIAVARRLGFRLTEEQLLKSHPIFHDNPADVLIFALTRQEWQKEKQLAPCQS